MKERYRTVAEGSSAIELREREKGFAGQSKAGERRTQKAESKKREGRDRSVLDVLILERECCKVRCGIQTEG